MEIRESLKQLPDIPEQARALIASLTLSTDDYRQIESLMAASFNAGLTAIGGPQPDVKMLCSYVTRLPTGNETGDYLALDLGGTNFRTLLVRLGRSGVPLEIMEDVYVVPEGLMHGSGTELFKFIAGTLREFVRGNDLCADDNGNRLKLGFNFSFPVEQTSISSGCLIMWTKGFSASGVVGTDVCRMLQNALDEAGLPIDCVALVNDTVGTLVACALEDPKCQISAIVGMGCNAAYVERVSAMERYSGIKAEQVVVNTEWGNFGADGCLDRFRTDFDRQIDRNGANAGFQVFEKLTCDANLGEIVRLALCSLVKAGVLFNGRMPQSLAKTMSFLTKYLSEIERDPPKHNYSTYRILTVDLEVVGVQPADAIIVRQVCEAVSTRSANLVATGIACLLKRIEPDGPMTVGVGGSLFKFHPHYPERMFAQIKKLYPECDLTLKLSDDGSGLGAAVIAALVGSSPAERPNLTIR